MQTSITKQRTPIPNSLPFACMALLVWATTTHGAGIEYPAPGHFDVEEGTLELWITPATDLYPKLKEKQFRGIMPLFSFSVADSFGMNASWIGKGSQYGVHVSMGSMAGDKSIIPLPGMGINWRGKEREPHHLAMTWRGKVMKMFADGIEVGMRHQAAGFSGKVAGEKIIIGHHRHRPTPVILHAVRLSNIARQEEDLKDVKPVIDIYTLLLDRFDSEGDIDAEGVTRADLVSGLSGEAGGVIRGAYRFITKPQPGIALSPNIKE